jgi:hypothetical protein
MECLIISIEAFSHQRLRFQLSHMPLSKKKQTKSTPNISKLEIENFIIIIFKTCSYFFHSEASVLEQC